jgi:hypothetical protein
MKHRSIIISIIAVLALGLMGYGYAAWNAQVAIGAPVNTGSFALGIAVPGTALLGTGTTDEAGIQDLTWGSDGAGLAGTTLSAYDVGSLIDADGPTQATGFAANTYYTTVKETYTNVYPDYQAGYTVDIKNGGTIPIQLQTPVTTWSGTSDSALTLQDDYFVYNWTLTDTNWILSTNSPTAVLASGTSDSINLTSASMDAIGNVILPAGHMATLTVNAYFNDDASTNAIAAALGQGATNTQTITINGLQFNH